MHSAKPSVSGRYPNLGPEGLIKAGISPGDRVGLQVEKSVESLLFYLAVLRAGHVYLPLNTAYKSDEIGYFIGDAEPAVFVCAPKDFAWASKLAFAAGTTFVFTLGDDRSGSLLERASHHLLGKAAAAITDRQRELVAVHVDIDIVRWSINVGLGVDRVLNEIMKHLAKPRRLAVRVERSGAERIFQRIAQAGVNRTVERVQHLRAIEGDRRDGVARLVFLRIAGLATRPVTASGCVM